MKKLIVFIAVVAIGFSIYYLLPYNIERTVDGYVHSYNASISEKRQIVIEGRVKRKLFNDDLFIGTIKIGDKEIKMETKKTESFIDGLVLRYTKNYHYLLPEETNSVTNTIESIFISRDYNKVWGHIVLEDNIKITFAAPAYDIDSMENTRNNIVNSQ